MMAYPEDMSLYRREIIVSCHASNVTTDKSMMSKNNSYSGPVSYFYPDFVYRLNVVFFVRPFVDSWIRAVPSVCCNPLCGCQDCGRVPKTTDTRNGDARKKTKCVCIEWTEILPLGNLCYSLIRAAVTQS